MKLLVRSKTSAVTAGDEKRLVAAAQRGCKDSFAELANRHRSGLMEFLRHRTAGPEDAEDLVQETFVRAWLKISQFSAQWRFSTWLYTIARRLAISHYRKRSLSPLPLEYESTVPRPDEVIAGREISANLWAIARTLPANQHEAIWLKYVEAMPVRDIAKVMNKTQVYVKVLLYRGRVALGKRIKYAAASHLSDRSERANYRINESAGV